MGLFGPKKMILFLEKNEYKPGEIIKGNVKLNFKNSTYVKNLTVSLKGFIERVSRGLQSQPNPTATYNIEVFKYDKVLSYEAEYQNNTLIFEIEIPKDIFEQSEIPQKNYKSIIGKKLVKWQYSLDKGCPLIWYISVDLEIPKKKDIHKIQEITISKN